MSRFYINTFYIYKKKVHRAAKKSYQLMRQLWINKSKLEPDL